jgi:hypothetical protein
VPTEQKFVTALHAALTALGWPWWESIQIISVLVSRAAVVVAALFVDNGVVWLGEHIRVWMKTEYSSIYPGSNFVIFWLVTIFNAALLATAAVRGGYDVLEALVSGMRRWRGRGGTE